MEDGTGIVHIAPAFGEDDSNVGKNIIYHIKSCWRRWMLY